MAKGQCTMKDIARVVGVSTYTVSRAINGKKDISSQLKERILSVAKEMGYVPNIAARNLQSGQTKTVALVLDDLQNIYYSMLLNKLTNKFQARGYHVTIYYDVDSINTLNKNLMKRVLSTNPDGIVSFLSMEPGSCKLNKIWKRPVVVIGVREEDPDTDCAYFDDVGGAEHVTRYLFSQGCKRIGFINASSKLSSGVNRCKGYLNVLDELGLEKDGELVICLEDTGLSVDEAVKILVEEKKVDAIFCFSDMIAINALWCLKEGNKDVKVAGWDNIAQAIKMPCNFVTVGADIDAMVDDVVESLLLRINNEEGPVLKKMYPVHLVV